MRLLILGASGRTGQLATTEALERGHTVIALVRKATAIVPKSGFTVIEGSPLDREDVERAFAHPEGKPDAVLVTLASNRETDSPFAKLTTPRFFMRNTVRNVMAIMNDHGVQRLVVMSALGTGESYNRLAWPLKLLFRYSNMRIQFEDHDAVDSEVRNEISATWTLVRPTILRDGEAKVVRVFGPMGEGVTLFDSATRASVAKFMVELAEGNAELERKTVVVAD